MERFGVIRGGLSPHQRRQVGDMDLLIAATALTHNLTLLTRNVADFQLVPGLTIYSST
jgi:predicted nucleic acid-binding protein